MLPNCRQERELWQRKKTVVFALDEAGRGPLAGPVIACAFCITDVRKKMSLPPIPVKDSKQLSSLQREKLYRWIKTVPYFAYTTGHIPHTTIDIVNIRQANFRAMRMAIKKLRTKVSSRRTVVFVDGNDPIPHIQFPQKTIVKGDTKVFSLACASIIAKVTRDRYMIRMAKKYPQYKFDMHKGYGTLLHRTLIKKYGLSPVHRKTFATKFTR